MPGNTEQKEKVKEIKISKDTLMYMLYLLFKSNFITRNHLRQMLNIIKQKTPEDLVKWLVQESMK